MKSKIDFKKAPRDGYDGKKVNIYIRDEWGQCEPINNNNHIVGGDDVKAIGWALRSNKKPRKHY